MGTFDETFPWDKGFGQAASSARWRKMASLWQADGVVQNYLNGLNATWLVSGSQVSINTGGCFIHGYYCEVQVAQTINVSGSGMIVARAQLANETADIYFKASALDYNGLEQSASNWETPLWLVSGTTLTDMRNWISPGAGGLSWWGQLAAAQTATPGQPVPIPIINARIPYATQARLAGSGLVTFSDASAAQTVTCSVTYQYGQSDAAATPVLIPQWPGGGTQGAPVSIPVSFSGWLVPVNIGKRSLGWLVQAGTGPQATVSQLVVSLELVNLGQWP